MVEVAPSGDKYGLARLAVLEREAHAPLAWSVVPSVA